ncbi:DUF808 domain-containing protein [Rhodalgimonas zhirmunskyi]|uniref:DUF808 domain-containing protein n=1 Tax=Rhodalgimonas zhirmunskyi TaxID=2964767 RepID=A0AAJ1X678_9RHOB|nr:DUF808 domain-containing protein [Rhodoalgimonas zhirmunskyi]MDQ2095226.1 DUF808 domain-containing protein [Rhodoalgimonas zhirmunskyi]
MSGLLALLDDVAAIAKVAAANVDDIATQAAKAGAKAAGAVIDDAAVAPAYVQGFHPNRELPIVGKIAFGSIRNKILILLPVALILSNFAPWLITPLLMLGGAYLAYEGAEKVYHKLFHKSHAEETHEGGDPAHLEEEKVAGAIKTDFILSAEIMTIALAALPKADNIWFEAAALGMVAVGITVAVYGSVALIVKADDVGLVMATKGRLGLTRALGRGIVDYMPAFLTLLVIVGTAAMLWVGGSILMHGADELGWHMPYDTIHHIAEGLVQGLPERWAGIFQWLATAAMDGIVALGVGVLLMPVANWVMGPIWKAVFKGKA